MHVQSLLLWTTSFLLVTCGVSQGKYASKNPKLENVQVVMFKRRSDVLENKALTRAVS